MALPLMEPLWERLEFPVSLQPVKTRTPSGEEVLVPKHWAVFREDAEETLDIVSGRYKLVPHGKVFRPMAQELIPSLPFDVDGVRTDMGLGGGYARVEWIFDHLVEVADGDMVQLSLLVQNSLDRSATLRGELSARRLICTNGLRGPGPSFWCSWKHRGSLDLDEVFNWVRGLLKRAPEMVDKWRIWNNQRMYPTTLRKFLETDSGAQGLIGKKSREGIVERLERVRAFKKPATVTVWQAYNALTEYATHRAKTRRADLQAPRQEQLHRLALRFASHVAKA
jgi:hypothetical protein